MSEKNQFQKFTINPSLHFYKEDGTKILQVEDVYEFCKLIDFTPNQIVQVGAANSGDFEFMPFIEQGSKALLIEPEPNFYQELKTKWGEIPNITILNVGVYKETGKFKFVKRWASTCLVELSDTPQLLDKPIDPEKDEFFEIDCITFDQIDDGKIDCLLLDMEGAEWFALEKMKSCPTILVVETHGPNGYINPYLTNIYHVLLNNGFLYVAENESDAILVSIKHITLKTK